MERFWALNLIHFLDFYFGFMLLAGVLRRLSQYHSVAQLVFAGPKRWPNLLKLLSNYRTIFWTWSMILPALLALGLWLVQMLASRLIFPDAGSPDEGMTIERLFQHWWALIPVIMIALPMLGFDLYTLWVMYDFDTQILEKHFDDAEYWLRSRTAHMVRVVSFGYINPRRMVAEEVEKALVAIGDMLNFTLWWVAVQMGLRFAFALSLWVTWAIT